MSFDTASIKETYKEKLAFYKSVNVKVAAFKREGDWHNYRTVVKLGFNSLEPGYHRLVDIGDFAVFEYNAHPDFLFEILKELEKTCSLDFQDVLILFGENPRIEYKERISGDREQSKDQLQYDWPIDYYTIAWTHKYNQNLIPILEDFTPGLRCHDPPYESVYDCVPSLLTLERWDYQSRGALRDSECSFIFPLEASIERCAIEGTNFQTSVRFHREVDPRHLRLSLIARGMDEAQRMQLKFGVKRRKTKQILRTTSIKRVLKGVADVQTFLFLEKRICHLDQRSVRNTRSEFNPRLLAHQVFDTTDRFFKYLYVEELRNSSRAQNFEWAVTTLLHFCGFQTERIGSQGLGSTPDILAFHPEKDLMIVGECDTGVPDQTKILNLMRRVELLEERIQGTILPVVFSGADDGLPRNLTSEVVVIGMDSLEKIFLAASRGENVDAILHMLESDWNYQLPSS